jgi:hypothetical protein
MGDAFGETVVPGPEYAARRKSILHVVSHKRASSVFDHWYGGFEEKEQKFPNRQAEEEEE